MEKQGNSSLGYVVIILHELIVMLFLDVAIIASWLNVISSNVTVESFVAT